MAVRLPDSDELVVLESTSFNESSDMFRGKILPGVVMVPFAKKIAEYPGAIAVRSRRGTPMSFTQQQRFWRLVKRLYARPYRNFVWAQLLRGLTGVERRCFCGLFCSQLVAELYQRMGWLCGNESPLDYVPSSFAKYDAPWLLAPLSEWRWLKPPEGFLKAPSELSFWLMAPKSVIT